MPDHLPDQSTGKLRTNSIGLLHIVFFVVAAAAPLTAVVGATPAAFAFGNGAGVPGTFILAGLLYLVFSAGFTAMSRYIGGAGAFYTYITEGLGRSAGLAGAAIAVLTYSAVQIAIYALFAVFLGAALQPIGFAPPWWALALIAVLVVTLCGRRNLEFSGNLLGICMIAELAILLLLDVAVLRRGGAEGLSFTSFTPVAVLAPGLGVSFVFVIGSYIGFEATAIFAEEARDQQRTIPRATYVAVILITLFYAFSTWAITLAYGPASVAAAAKANADGFYFAQATQYLGEWAAQVMQVLLITSLFACVLSFHSTINRYLFSLGRAGIAWSGLGTVHPSHGSPAAAGLVQSASAVIVIIVFAATGADPYGVVFSWMAALSVIGILVVQIMVCLAVIAFFYVDRRALGPWPRLIAPALGAVGIIWVLAQVIANLPLLSGSDSSLVMLLPSLVVVTGLAGGLYRKNFFF
jgi:amino acid transporter